MKSKKLKRILIISFFFPPNTKAGAKRFTFLSSFFNEKYDDLHILTVKEKFIFPKDYSLLGCGTIHRTGMTPNYPPINDDNILIKVLRRLWEDYLCILDPYVGWIIPALIKGIKIKRNRKINLIIATGPPFTAMVIGFILSRMTEAKLILDYRDPWSNHERRFGKILGKKIGKILEILAVKEASALVFCSAVMRNNFLNSFGKYIKAPNHVVTNGFNYKNRIRGKIIGEGKKNIIYAGHFYGERRIGLLANALSTLKYEGLMNKDNFCLHVFGKLCNEDKETIRKYCLEDIIEEHDIAPYDELIKYLRGGDISLLISGTDVSYAIPYKLFDYLSVKKPILAIAPKKSAVAEMMKNIDCGRLANINSEESILLNLRKILFEEKEYSFTGARFYTWNRISHKYLGIIDKIEI